MKIIFILLVALISLFPFHTHAEVLDTIDAVVNGELILSGEVDDMLRLETNFTTLSPREQTVARRNLLRSFIDEILIVQAARERLDDAMREEIATQIELMTNRQMAQIREQFTSPQDLLKLEQQSGGLSWEDLRRLRSRQIERRYLRENVAKRLAQKPIASPTERELAEFKQQHPELAPGEEIQIAHILLSVPQTATPSQMNSVQTRAQELALRARNGEPFGALAQQYSAHEASRVNGGDLGSWKKETIREEFAFLFDKQEGFISSPIRTSSGFHIVKVIDIPTWKDVYLNTKNAENVDEWINKIRSEADIKIRYDDELAEELKLNKPSE